MSVELPLSCHCPIQAEAAGAKHPYEVLFRSAYKLLMDTATSEYLFCAEFWAGDHKIFNEIFLVPVAAVEENLTAYLGTCVDVLTLIIMVRTAIRSPSLFSRAESAF